jgi:hypothetical protein
MPKRIIKNEKENDVMGKISMPKYNLKNKNLSKTKYHFKNDKTVDIMYIPPIEINYNDILNIYNVNSIDSLNKFIDDNIYFQYKITRIINCWIRNNYNELLKHNNYLVNIILKYLLKYKSKTENIVNLDDKIKKYIDYWLNKNKSDDFKLDILDDIIQYFINKYKNIII